MREESQAPKLSSHCSKGTLPRHCLVETHIIQGTFVYEWWCLYPKALFQQVAFFWWCRFWDWKSGNCFQQHATQVQPGSLESEAGIFAMTFDQTGSRLICAEADKTIKLFKEDEQATPETHPVSFRPPKDIRRFWVVSFIFWISQVKLSQ